MKAIILSLILIYICGCKSSEPAAQHQAIPLTPILDSIPAKPITPKSTKSRINTYTVRRGDSLSKIAYNIYGDPAQWRKIQKANRDKLGANGVNVKIGQILRIPCSNMTQSEIATQTTQTLSTTSSIAIATGTHTPQQTHTIGSISISADSIKVYSDKSVSAEGNVTLKSQKETITADSIAIVIEEDGTIVATCENATLKKINSKIIMRGSSMKKLYRPKPNSIKFTE